jgi:hypothetical protein
MVLMSRKLARLSGDGETVNRILPDHKTNTTDGLFRLVAGAESGAHRAPSGILEAC